MRDRPNLCVFCGSQRGSRPEYEQAARSVGIAMAARGLGLVYGGGRIGLMGALADATLAAGGRVIGVIPEPLTTRELAHEGCSELIVVPGMHERKALMARKASAFLVMPGGVGTFEEFFEVLSWTILGFQDKPIGLLNVNGYFDPLLALFEHAAAERFIRPAQLEALLISDDPGELVARLPNFRPPAPGPIWLDLEQDPEGA